MWFRDFPAMVDDTAGYTHWLIPMRSFGLKELLQFIKSSPARNGIELSSAIKHG
jgi:hypothetical protein